MYAMTVKQVEFSIEGKNVGIEKVLAEIEKLDYSV